jgi:hypothetical protein
MSIPLVEENLYSHLNEGQQFEHAVSSAVCQVKALLIMKEIEIQVFSTATVISTSTLNEKILQRLPNVYEEKV